jgi:hypothetical protein
MLAAGSGGALQNPSTRISPDGQASGGASRRSSMAFRAIEVSWLADDPARSPIAWDAIAEPEAAPAIFGFVQLPEVCVMFGTELTGDGAEGTVAGQNTLCALANSPEKTIALTKTTSARIAPLLLFTCENPPNDLPHHGARIRNIECRRRLNEWIVSRVCDHACVFFATFT